MSVRRLDTVQPDAFKFSAANLKWARETIGKYPEGKQASAVIPLLWRAQEQHDGWLPKPAIEYVAEMLEMSFIRVYEVATFYTMFQLSPVGKKAHVQVCGTTPCMLRGAEDLIRVCKAKISQTPHTLSADGDFSWEEVECLGVCVNAPMIQIFKDTYEDLTPETLDRLLEDIAAGRKIHPGPQIERQFSAPSNGLTSLTDEAAINRGLNGSGRSRKAGQKTTSKKAATGRGRTTITVAEKTSAKRAPTKEAAKAAFKKKPPSSTSVKAQQAVIGRKPRKAAKPKQPDDLKLISGVGPKLEGVLNGLGIYKFSQIAKWTRDEIDWVDDHLKFKGRIERDGWLAQADALATGGTEEYVRRFGKKPR